MKLAIDLAMNGIGKVNPNPLVGAVIVKNNEIIGSGFHEKYGELHAERKALQNCKVSPRGGTMYVTLEPCCHYGKTPPCTEAIIQSGIKKVVIGCLDVNEKVAGKGVKLLQDANIEVVTGLLEKECRELNDIFFHYIQNRTPYVLMKYAMTMDGKIATTVGKSKWITNEKSREDVHRLRNQYMAIMVGIGTILADDSELTCRLSQGRNPIRIICDSHLKTPLNSKVVQSAHSIKTIIATLSTDKCLHKSYLEKGVEIIVTRSSEGVVDLKQLMQLLGAKGIDSILLEGGSCLNFSAVDSQIINKVYCYISPKIFGGSTSKSPVMGRGFDDVNNKIKLDISKVLNFDDNILIESRVSYVHGDN